MPRLDLVLALIRAGSSGDAVGVRSAAEAIATEEAQRGHRSAAERLRAALAPTIFHGNVPLGSEQAHGLFVELPARTGLDGLLLEGRARADLVALVREQKQARKLSSRGLAPRHKVLLSGPPGNGKTSVAGALAHDLDVPLKVVSYGSLVGSLLGETIQRIDLLFARAADKPCVLFFDEFEALGKERADGQETGEMKRALASMLTRIDTLAPSTVVVAATNHPEMLDRAVWRRFEVKLVLGPPNHSQGISYLIGQLGLEPDVRAAQLLAKIPSSSYAELKDFSLDVRRRAVLDAIDLTDALIQELLVRFPEIDWPFDDDRSLQAAASPESPKKSGKTDRKAPGRARN